MNRVAILVASSFFALGASAQDRDVYSYSLTPMIVVHYHHYYHDERNPEPPKPNDDPRLKPIVDQLTALDESTRTLQDEIRENSRCEVKVRVELNKAPFDPSTGGIGYESEVLLRDPHESAGKLLVPKFALATKYNLFCSTEEVIKRIPQIAEVIQDIANWVKSTGYQCGIVQPESEPLENAVSEIQKKSPPEQKSPPVATKKKKAAPIVPDNLKPREYDVSRPASEAEALQAMQSKLNFELFWRSTDSEYPCDENVNTSAHIYYDRYSTRPAGKKLVIQFRDKKLLQTLLNNILYLESYSQLVQKVQALESLAAKKGGKVKIQAFFQRYVVDLNNFTPEGQGDNPALALDVLLTSGNAVLCRTPVYPYEKRAYSKLHPPFEPDRIYQALLLFEKKCL